MARCSISFEMGFKNLEWRYHFYVEGSPLTIADDYANLEGPKRSFLDAVLNMHGAGVEMVSVAVADDENPGEGNSKKRKIGLSSPWTTHSTNSRITDVTGNSMLTSMFAADGGRRKLTLSGLPDAMIERNPDGSPVRNAIFHQAWNLLHPLMLAQGFQIKVTLEPEENALIRVRTMEPAKVSVGDPAVIVEDASHTLFTTAVNHGFEVGDTVDFIHREPTRATEELTGTFKIVEVPGVTKFVVSARVNFRGTNYIPKELHVYTPTYDAKPITQWFFDDWGTKKRGEGGGPKGKAASKRKKAV